MVRDYWGLCLNELLCELVVFLQDTKWCISEGSRVGYGFLTVKVVTRCILELFFWIMFTGN